MRRKSSFLSKYKPVLTDNRELVSGIKRTFYLYNLPSKLVIANPLNNRFALEEEVDEDIQFNMIVEEDQIRTANLGESLKRMPFTDIPVGRPRKNYVETVHGARRVIIAKRLAKFPTVLIWIPEELSEEEYEILRDFPETNPTKVEHSPFVINKIIYLELKKAERSVEAREQVLNRLVQRYKWSKERLEKAETTYERMLGICKEFDEDIKSRQDQMKAFEAYNSLQNNQFAVLRQLGDFERVELLDQLAKKYLFFRIAHDDMTVTISGLADFDKEEPLLHEIRTGSRNINNIDELRKLRPAVEMITGATSDPTSDVRRILNQAFRTLMQTRQISHTETVLQEVLIFQQKFQSLLSDAQRVPQ